MSLLIDALKQAEAARAQAQSGESTVRQAGLELEPLSSAEDVRPPQAPERTGGPAPTRPSSAKRSRVSVQPPNPQSNEAARGLFEVKHQQRDRLPLILAAVGLSVLLVGAGYVWWATQPRSSLLAAGAGTKLSAPLPATNAMTTAAADTGADLPIAAEPEAPHADNPPTPREAAIMQRVPSPARTATRASRRREAPRATRAPSRDAPSDSASQPKIIATNASQDSGGVQAAYTAFLEGNYAQARQRYQEVLRQDPRNLDAMNALGLIAWRNGLPDVAERMFRAALHADPKDATASAQLAMLYAEGEPGSAESRLRSLIASQPAAPAPYFALGSLLSRQERWSEAQQALFQAYTLDSENPDTLFNLAVSLEHLSQPTVARQFYERALLAAKRRPAGFDKNAAESRVQKLGGR